MSRPVKMRASRLQIPSVSGPLSSFSSCRNISKRSLIPLLRHLGTLPAVGEGFFRDGLSGNLPAGLVILVPGMRLAITGFAFRRYYLWLRHRWGILCRFLNTCFIETNNWLRKRIISIFGICRPCRPHFVPVDFPGNSLMGFIKDDASVASRDSGSKS